MILIITQKIKKKYYDLLDKILLTDSYKIKHIDQATQRDLYIELNSPDNFAVFWIAHSNSFGIPGFKSSAIDFEGVNILPLFDKVNPNIRWIGVIGCKTQNIIQELNKKNLFEQTFYTPDLDNGIISPEFGLEESFKEFNNFYLAQEYKKYEQLPESPLENKSKTLLEITRTSEDGTPVQILYKGNFLALSDISLNEKIEIPFPLEDFLNGKAIKLLVDTGINSIGGNIVNAEDLIIKLIDKEKNKQYLFSPLRLRSGKIFGTTKFIYKLKIETN